MLEPRLVLATPLVSVLPVGGGGVVPPPQLAAKASDAALACTKPKPVLSSRPATSKSIAVFFNALRTSSALQLMLLLHTKAATPVTCGVAIEVPL